MPFYLLIQIQFQHYQQHRKQFHNVFSRKKTDNKILVIFFEIFTFNFFLIISRSIGPGKYKCNNDAQNTISSVYEFEKFVIDFFYSINKIIYTKKTRIENK